MGRWEIYTKILVEIPVRKGLYRISTGRYMIILKWIVKKRACYCEVDWTDLACGPLAGSYEHGNEPSDFAKCGRSSWSASQEENSSLWMSWVKLSNLNVCLSQH
jgi:hypothetical protein